MSDLLKTLCVAALVAFGGLAQAQTDTTQSDSTPTEPAQTADQPAADVPADSGLNMGEEVGSSPADGVGATYIQSEHGDWKVRCVRAAEGPDPCQLYQLLSDQNGNAVAEISMFGVPKGQQAAAGATVLTPLETLLTQQMTLAVDSGTAKRYPFNYCAAAGCYAHIGFTQADVAAFKAGAKATLVIVPAFAPDEKVTLTVSLKGFTAGFDAVNAANGL